MDLRQVISKLKECERDLRDRGVTHAAIFGSRVRGDNRDDSDIDVLVELDPNARIGVPQLVRLSEYIESLFDGPVDVVDFEALKPAITRAAIANAVYAF